MKRNLAIILTVLMLFPIIFASCGGPNEVAPDDAPDFESDIDNFPDESVNDSKEDEEIPEEPLFDPNLALDKSKRYNILFIGNSYTFYNEMPALFAKYAKSAGYNVVVHSITNGGHTLYEFASKADTYGAQVDTALQEKKYDYIIMQEHSLCPITDPAAFYTGVRSLYKKINETQDENVKCVLYSTWGRHSASVDLNSRGLTNETMTWKLAAAYTAIGKELDIDVAPVGLAFYDIYSNISKYRINLYDPDRTHPSLEGSHLAAMTIFAKIFGIHPGEINISSSLASNITETLAEVAAKTVAKTPEIPEEYVVSSENVRLDDIIKADDSGRVMLTEFPKSEIISVITDSSSFTGILGTKGQIASKETSFTTLTDSQKADIADIGYGVSVIGIDRMNEEQKGAATAVENLVNGHWGSSYMASFIFDDNKYNINGNVDPEGKFRCLITLNFGSAQIFDAIGFFSGSLQGFPGAAEVYVSDDGEKWELVPSACWDAINGKLLENVGQSPADPWKGNTAKVSCLFSMNGVTGQYIRIGVVHGRSDSPSQFNTINTREVVVYGSPAK